MKKLTSLLLIGFMFLAVSVTTQVQAQASYNLKEMTPSIKQALENRRDRFDQLKALKAKNEIGENNQGYLEAFVDSGSVQTMIDQENADRKIIYTAIAEQNNLTDAVGVIEKVFGQVQSDKALAGEKIQDESGSWITKN